MRNLRDVSGYITDMIIYRREKAYFELVMKTDTGDRHEVLLNSEFLFKTFPSEYDDYGEFLLSYRGHEAKNFLWKLAPAIEHHDIEFSFRGICISINMESNEEVEPAKPKEEEPTTKEIHEHDDSDLRNAIKFCEVIFEEKMRLYGASFCHMHPETVTDQLYMKATILKNRLTDRDKGKKFALAFFEGMRDEFAAVVNYAVIALRQGGFGLQTLEVPESPMRFYSDQMQAALSLISEKGDDYGELWREQRIGTLADMIYTKVLRVKRIENQYRVGGMTEEGYHKFVEDQYRDMINYGLFGVVRTDDICNVLALTVYEDEEEFE